MTNFLLFNLTLLASTFAATLTYSIGLGATSALAYPWYKAKGWLNVVLSPALLPLLLFHYCFWVAWAVYCSVSITDYIGRPEVSHHWLYWLAGYSWSQSVLGWFSHREAAHPETTTEQRHNISRASSKLGWLTLISFLVFSLYVKPSNVTYSEYFVSGGEIKFKPFFTTEGQRMTLFENTLYSSVLAMNNDVKIQYFPVTGQEALNNRELFLRGALKSYADIEDDFLLEINSNYSKRLGLYMEALNEAVVSGQSTPIHKSPAVSLLYADWLQSANSSKANVISIFEDTEYAQRVSSYYELLNTLTIMHFSSIDLMHVLAKNMIREIVNESVTDMEENLAKVLLELNARSKLNLHILDAVDEETLAAIPLPISEWHKTVIELNRYMSSDAFIDSGNIQAMFEPNSSIGKKLIEHINWLKAHEEDLHIFLTTKIELLWEKAL